jgi:site-specific recombinase XerD
MKDQSGRVRVTGPLLPYAEGFRAELAERGYASSSAAKQLRLLAHLSRWLASQGLEAAELVPQQVERFLAARHAAGYSRPPSLRGFSPLLGYLRGLGVVPGPPPRAANSPLEELLNAYRGYLLRERGLVATTIGSYDTVARRFLLERAADGELKLEDLVAADVTRFVLGECGSRQVGDAKNVVTALRSLLRYLHLEGRTPMQLAPAVPAVAGWRGSSLPRGLEPDQVASLLASCDRRTAVGRRDYAILMLLVRLGLRANEVAALELEDIDWRAGEVTVRGKGCRQERLPLPVDVGEALVDYLRHGRPSRPCSRLFVRLMAPYAGATNHVVFGVVHSACTRAGLPQLGAHRLRHTAATEMLRAGVPLSAVGQVLRHRSLTTTAIYAKVDRAELRSLAQPWPGGAA